MKPTHRGHCSKLNTTMEKECQVTEERTKARFTQKEKWFKENWNFECKPRTDKENKTNFQQHKDLESGSRKPHKIPRDFFKLKKLTETLDLRQRDLI